MANSPGEQPTAPLKIIMLIPVAADLARYTVYLFDYCCALRTGWSVQAQIIVVDPLFRASLLVVQVHLSRRSVQVDRLVKNPVRRLVDPIDGVDNVNAT